MNVARDCIANFCGPRELFELARVCSRWRQVPRVARVARVFHDALREESASSIVANCRTSQWNRYDLLPKGELAVRDTPMRTLLERITSSFAFAGMREMSVYLAKCVAHRLGAAHFDEIIRLADCIRCDVQMYREYSHSGLNLRTPIGPFFLHDILCELDIQGAVDPEHLREVMRVLANARSSPISIILYALVRCTAPCARMSSFLECAVTNDAAGCYEFIAHVPSDVIRDDLADAVFWVFERATSSRVLIGPVLARELITRISCMHHVVAQVSRDSPEFDAYLERLDFVIRAHWIPAKWGHESAAAMHRARICDNLMSAARNPDARVFDIVSARIRDAELFSCIDGACDIPAWNCGDGIEGLRRLLARLDGLNLRARFEHDTFWRELRIDALSTRDAVECVDLILAHRPDLRSTCSVLSAAREFFAFCISRFGEPMREMLARYHVAH